MATTITVPGANGTTVSLSYDTQSNAALAQRIADAIRNGVDNNTILPVDNKFGPPPPLPTGVTGEFIQSIPAVSLLTPGFVDVVNTAKTGAIYGSGDANEQVLSSGKGNLTFYATGGSGTVAAGGGNNLVSIPTTDTGAWLIATGNGNDTIRAMGPGNDTISAGGGSNVIQLGTGNSFIVSGGADTIFASMGSETITSGDTKAADVVYGNASNIDLNFVGGAGATVFGGTGSDTVLGGTGSDLLFGGSAGNNFLQAGSGPATLFGGGNDDQLYAGGGSPQELHAGAGNETLFGGFASGSNTFYGGTGSDQIFGGGGSNTFVGAAGSATITAGASNLFEFINSAATSGGMDTVEGLTNASQVNIALTGYGPSEAANAVAGQTTNGSSVTISLSDGTKVTFENITHLTSSNFT
jgi:Ca2+-binding RTX toxin-like protein